MRATRFISVLAGLTAIAFVTASAQAVYHPGLGRFLERDPGPDAGAPMRLGAAGSAVGGGFIPRDPTTTNQYADGMNLYQYVGSNPVNWVDYTGKGKEKPDGGGTESKRAIPPEYQPDLPPVIPSGDEVEINLEVRSLGNKAGGLCGHRKITRIQNLKVDLTWTDLKGDGTGCDFYKKLASDDEVKKQMNDVVGKRKELKCAKKCLGLGKNYRCCNKAKFNGTYPVKVVIHPIWLTELLSKKPICQLSGSITATVTATGEIGTWFKED